jgi:hypothetical protein
MYKDQHVTTALVMGTICGLFRILQSEEFIKTILLTAVSASVSYGVSFFAADNNKADEKITISFPLSEKKNQPYAKNRFHNINHSLCYHFLYKCI